MHDFTGTRPPTLNDLHFILGKLRLHRGRAYRCSGALAHDADSINFYPSGQFHFSPPQVTSKRASNRSGKSPFYLCRGLLIIDSDLRVDNKE